MSSAFDLGYALAVALAFVVGFVVKRRDERAIGLTRVPGHRWIAFAALAGAIVGSKLGMVLYVPPSELASVLFAIEGRTVLGAIAGGYVAVEVCKRAIGHRESTGDAYAVALPLGQAIGRVGCLLGGCCFGAETDLPWAIVHDGVARHPAALYEGALDLVVAAVAIALRGRGHVLGFRFRATLAGMAAARFVVDPFRGDPRELAFGMTLVQWFCLAVVIGFGAWLAANRKVSEPALAAAT